MQLDAAMGSTMTERFNVAGAMLVKLFGRPRRGGRGVRQPGRPGPRHRRHDRDVRVDAVHRADLAGVAGHRGRLRARRAAGHRRHLQDRHAGRAGRADRPAVRADHVAVQRPGRRHDRAGQLRPGLRGARPEAADRGRAGRRAAAQPARHAPAIEFDHVRFRYPTASEVSLASLESIALPVPERTDANADVLRDISFHAPGRQAHRAGRPVGRGQDHDHRTGGQAL